MPGKKYRSIKGGKSKKAIRLYNKLKRRGHSKSSAAAITNAQKFKKGRSKKKSTRKKRTARKRKRK